MDRRRGEKGGSGVATASPLGSDSSLTPMSDPGTLLRTQRRVRINAGGAECRDCAGAERDDDHERRHRRVRHGIGRGLPEQQRLNPAAGEHRGYEPQRDAGDREAHALADNEAQDIPAPCPERNSDPELVRSLRDVVTRQ